MNRFQQPIASKRWLAILGLVSLIPLTAGGLCGGSSGGGGGGTGGNTSGLASVELAYRTGPFPTPGTNTNDCTGSVRWRLTPMPPLTGTTGSDTPVDLTENYATHSAQSGPNNQWYCTFPKSISGLKAGKWTVSATAPLWTASCVVELKAGTNYVHFQENVNGCVNDPIKFPGD